MYLQNELKHIAKRLFDERICLQPLDERSLNLIYRYMGTDDTGSDLMRRVSDIELNCDEITEVATNAVNSVKDFLISCENLFKTLIDNWNEKGLINNYSLSVSKKDLSDIYHSYSIVAESLTSKIQMLASTSSILAETAIQIKACSASFLEVFNETRLAYYAAALNKDKDNLLSCRAISLQAHDSASECKRNASKFLSVAKSCDIALSVINSVLSESAVFFGSVPEVKQINTSALVNIFIRGIESLKNITSSIKIV